MFIKVWSYFFRNLALFLHGSLMISIIGLTGVTHASVQALPHSDHEIEYAFGDLPTSAYDALIEAIGSRPTGILDGGTYFVVGNYQSDGTWGIGHLAAAMGTEPPSWENSVWFIVQINDPVDIALEGTSSFNNLIAASSFFVKQQFPILRSEDSGVSTETNSFLFPWDQSQQWRYTFGWHGSTGLALDFAPSNVLPANMWVLASGSGIVTLYCGDGYQAAIELSTTSGSTVYRHIDYNSFTAQNITNLSVSQGQKLSLLYNGTVGGGYYDINTNYPYNSCIQGSSPSCIHIQFMTYCGSGSGPHVHWSLPAKPFTVEGWQVDTNGQWTKSGQPARHVGALFSSTNSSTSIASPAIFTSEGILDGQILESAETSNIGGIKNSTATTFNLGDDLADRQYRAILHFDTSPLPDNAIITAATLKIKKQGQAGTNPFTILGNLRVDMRKPAFGTAALALPDFKSPAGENNVSTFGVTPLANWYSASLNATGNSYINRTGTTQFRLRFTIDDNNDNGNDFMKFYSGDAKMSNRPQLIIEYYVP